MRDCINLLGLLLFPATLRAEFDIGTTGGPLDFITTAFQTAVDFLTGPAGTGLPGRLHRRGRRNVGLCAQEWRSWYCIPGDHGVAGYLQPVPGHQ